MVNSKPEWLMERTCRVLGLLLVSFLNYMPLSEATEKTNDLIELKVELPKPVSMGTPFDGFRPNLEKMNYVERPPLMAPAETQIVSQNKPVSSSAAPLRGTLAQIVDGRKGHEENCHIELPPGLQWVQVDLELQVEIQAIYLWQYRRGVRVYFDVIGQISADPEFKAGVTQFYNNDFDNSAGFGAGSDPEYFETYKGREFVLPGVRGRYVRFYSQGHFHGDSNDFVEVEVWGKKPHN